MIRIKKIDWGIYQTDKIKRSKLGNTQSGVFLCNNSASFSLEISSRVLFLAEKYSKVLIKVSDTLAWVSSDPPMTEKSSEVVMRL